jgi:hypothetical protein
MWSVTDQNGFESDLETSGKDFIWECIEWKRSMLDSAGTTRNIFPSSLFYIRMGMEARQSLFSLPLSSLVEINTVLYVLKSKESGRGPPDGDVWIGEPFDGLKI